MAISRHGSLNAALGQPSKYGKARSRTRRYTQSSTVSGDMWVGFREFKLLPELWNLTPPAKLALHAVVQRR